MGRDTGEEGAAAAAAAAVAAVALAASAIERGEARQTHTGKPDEEAERGGEGRTDTGG